MSTGFLTHFNQQKGHPMKTKLIVCVGALSLMSASMVFAAPNNTSTVQQKKVTAKTTKHSKQKNTKKANKVNEQPQIAAKAPMQPQIKPFHELPALHVWGYGGSHTIGQGQGLMPLISSNQSKNLYVLAEGKETYY